MLKKLFLLFFLLSVVCSAKDELYRASAFKIKVFNSNGEKVIKNCTATLLIKTDGDIKSNHFISNAHCIPKYNSVIKLYSLDEKSEYELEISKIDPNMDMVELAFKGTSPLFLSHIEEMCCNGFSKAKMSIGNLEKPKNNLPYFGDSAKRSLEAKAYGFNHSGQQVHHTNNGSLFIPFKNKHLIPSGLPGIDWFIEYDGMSVVSGMSGGYVENENGEYVGMTTRTVYTSNKAIVLAADDILKFINKRYITDKIGTNERVIVPWQNRGIPTGGDEHDGTGGDEHDGTNAKACGDLNSTRPNLTFFRKFLYPLIVDGKYLLGVNNQPIRDRADQEIYYDPFKNNLTLEDLITLEANGYLSNWYRKQILSSKEWGLKGKYSEITEDTGISIIHGYNEKNIREVIAMGTIHSQLEVRKGSIKFSIFGRSLNKTGDSGPRLSDPYQHDFEFKVKYENKNRELKLVLKDSDVILTCDNRGFRTLTCHSDDPEIRNQMEFSIKMVDAKKGILEYNFTQWERFDGKTVVGHYNGRLQR